jgi:hypothetical protein
MIVLLHVDDLAIGYDKKYSGYRAVIKRLTTKFKATQQPLSCFLSASIRRDVDMGVIISQEPAVLQILSRFSEWVGHPAHSPLDVKVRLSQYYESDSKKPQFAPADKNFPYKSIIGSLGYLACISRCDIAYAVNLLSHFSSDARRVHQDALCRLLGYLQAHPAECIHYSAGKPLFLHAYADASHLTHELHSRSQIAYIACLAGAPIAWRSKMPKVPYLSSTTAEIAALREAVKAVVALRLMLIELGMAVEPTPIFEDNSATVHVSVSVKHTTRLRHVLKDCNWLQYHVEAGNVVVLAVSTKKQLADWLTKAFSKADHERFVRALMDVVPMVQTELAMPCSSVFPLLL